jgi:ketosteroid isomerase-like protein
MDTRLTSAQAALVRRIYDERMLDSNHASLLELAADDITYVNPPDAVEPGIRRGRESVAAVLQGLHAVFPDGWNELVQLFDEGSCVVAAVRFRASARESDVEVVQEECHTWTIVDGRISSFEWGRDLDAALRAARAS